MLGQDRPILPIGKTSPGTRSRCPATDAADRHEAYEEPLPSAMGGRARLTGHSSIDTAAPSAGNDGALTSTSHPPPLALHKRDPFRIAAKRWRHPDQPRSRETHGSLPALTCSATFSALILSGWFHDELWGV